MIITNIRKKVSVGTVLLLIFLTIFMFRFIKVTLNKDVKGNLAYVQLLNAGMPVVKATYYDKEAYIESNVTLKSLILEALNIKHLDPIDLVIKQIPYFASISTEGSVERPDYLDISNIISFNLNDGSIDKVAKGENHKSSSENPAYDPSLKKQLNQSKPEVLIYHTHTTESYSTKDVGDENKNVVGVGNLVAKELEENYGISVIHDTTMHSASYNDSYRTSRETVKKYLDKYGDFKMIIDLHRDSVKDEHRNGLVGNINGEKVAKIMFVLDQTNKNYEYILARANRMKENAEKLFPGLSRGKHFYYKKGSMHFNQDLNKNTFLIEVGANVNIPEEAQASAKYIARLIAEEINRK